MPFESKATMPNQKKKIKQMTPQERTLIDQAIRVKQATPTEALQKVNEKRAKNRIRPLEKGAVHRFAKGLTYNLATEETRGRAKALTRAQINRLDKARNRLIKEADNDYRVTYDDVIEECGMEGVVCKRVVEDALRERGVSYKAPRRKIYVTSEDAKERYKFAKKKVKLPSKFWGEDVHAYVDNKSFPVPLTAKQRKRFRQTQVTGHLRKAAEGLDRGFTKPREAHSFLGIPSVNITGAVARDKIILWHVNVKSWGGKAAAEMYTDHLKPALVKKWGNLKRFRIIEDGDRKGNYSNKGVDAKRAANIYPWKLPPRSPSLMPLDYSIWRRIVQKSLDEAPPRRTETKEEFLARLRKIATSLSKPYIKKVIAEMKPRLAALKDARGYTPKND